MTRGARLAIVAFGAVLAAAPAHADTTGAASWHYERAKAAFALGRYAEAAVECERAFDLKPDPALLWDAAEAHRIAGNDRRALQLLQDYLRVYGERTAQSALVKQRIAELKLGPAARHGGKPLERAAPLAPA
jgi:hypothetical protein